MTGFRRDPFKQGGCVTSLPITPEKVLRALEAGARLASDA